MRYAHIFKAGDRWQLIITSTPSLVGSSTEGFYATKTAAKARAESLGAKPWNY